MYYVYLHMYYLHEYFYEVDYRIKNFFILLTFLLTWHVSFTPSSYYSLFTIAGVARYHLSKSPINNKKI